MGGQGAGGAWRRQESQIRWDEGRSLTVAVRIAGATGCRRDGLQARRIANFRKLRGHFGFSSGRVLKMRAMVIGGGGREHALAYGLAKSARVEQVLCAPGNAG